MTVSLPAGPLCVNNAGVSAGGTRILNSVDLTLHPGDMCALIGPSGAGKSTLIKALLGLRDPDDGSVTMGSVPVADLGPVRYVPQDDTLHRALTVQRELGYAAELRMPGVSTEDRESRIAEVLEQVGLSDRTSVRIRRLSGGQRKRVSVALELLTGRIVVGFARREGCQYARVRRWRRASSVHLPLRADPRQHADVSCSVTAGPGPVAGRDPDLDEIFTTRTGA